MKKKTLITTMKSQCRDSVIDWHAATDAMKRVVRVSEVLRHFGAPTAKCTACVIP